MLDMIPFDAQIWFAWATWFTFVVVLAGSMTVTMSGFFGWHVYLILTNQTTIEFQFNKFKVLTQKRSGKVVLNEYDIGMKNNVEQIFGKHRWWILLFLPSLSKPPLNGCEYPTMSNLQDFNEFNKSNKVDNLV
jgi:palmitoyltransferase